MFSGKNGVFICLKIVVKFFINILLYTYTECFLQTFVYISGLLTQLASFLYTPGFLFLTVVINTLSPQTTALTTTTNYLNFNYYN